MNWKKIFAWMPVFFLLLFFLSVSYSSQVSAASNTTYCSWNDSTQKCTQVVECNSGCVSQNLNCPNRTKEDLCIGTFNCNCAGPGTLSCTYSPGSAQVPIDKCQRSGSCGTGYQPSPQTDPCFSTSISENECLSRNAGTCVPVSILQPTPAGGTYNICQNDTTGQCLPCVTAHNAWTAIGCIQTSDPQAFISWLLGAAIGLAGGIAVLLIIFGGFLIILSSGDPQRLQAGKDILTSAIIGLVVIIFAVFLLRIIGVEILKIPGFE